MSTYAVEIPSEKCWAVYQSTSQTMYTPVFEEQLPAILFALLYSRRAYTVEQLLTRDYSEPAQMRLAALLVSWIDQVAPRPPGRRRAQRVLPEPWLDQLEPRDPDDPDWERTYDALQLVVDLEMGTRQAIDVVLGAFNEWLQTAPTR